MQYALMLSSPVPPKETIGVARLAEGVGFRRIWLTEDYTVGNTRLQYPATTDAPTWLAAEGPQMLALAREHADGVVFFAFSTPAYLEWTMPILGKNGPYRTAL